MTVDEVIEIREEAKRFLSTAALRRLAPQLEILEPVGARVSWTLAPKHELSIGVKNEPVVGSRVEEAARIVRRAVRGKRAPVRA